MRYYPNGTGELTGDRYATMKPLSLTGQIWYVHYPTGIDHADPTHGKNREFPLKTLSKAISNSAAGDWIVLMDGHSEPVDSTLTLKSNHVVVGGGLSAGRPTSTLQFGANAQLVLGAGAQVRGVKFTRTAQAAATPISASGAYSQVVGCYFEVGQYDVSAIIIITASGVKVLDCHFVIVSHAPDPWAPYTAIYCNTASLTDITIADTVIDVAGYGFASGAIYMNTAVAGLHIIGVTLKGADAEIHSSSTGTLQVSATGGARVAW